MSRQCRCDTDSPSYLRQSLLDLHPRPVIRAASPRPPARAGAAGGAGGGSVAAGGGHEGGGHVVGGAPQPLGQVGRRDGVGDLFQHIPEQRGRPEGGIKGGFAAIANSA